jgi:hypothetical protein
MIPRMTRDEQIKKALSLLQPADRSACSRCLNQALDDLDISRSQNRVLEDLYAKGSRKSLKAYRDVVDRARWGWSSHDPELAALRPGTSLVEIELEPKDGGTLLRLHHSRLPPRT